MKFTVPHVGTCNHKSDRKAANVDVTHKLSTVSVVAFSHIRNLCPVFPSVFS